MRKTNKPWFLQYDQGVPAEIVIPDLTLVDLLKDAVTTHGSSTCTITNQEKLTYFQIDDNSDRVARFLLENGLNKGDRVGVLLLNSPAFVISYFGILKAGGVVMALNPAYRPNEIRKLAIESGIRILILQESAYQEIKPVQPETFIEMMVVVGRKSVLPDSDDLSWGDLLQRYSDGDPIETLVKPEDPAVFQYSGGTTGTPKCAIGLHRNLVANVYQFSHWLVNIEPGQEKVLVVIPLYHVYGMVLGMNLAVKIKSSMILISNPRDMEGLLHAVEEFKATVFPGVPNIYAAINHYPKVLAGEYDLSSIKACISGSATLPVRVKREFEALTNGHLVEGYGLSEAPTATHCNPILGENREGSIGLPLPNVDCKIVDLETGTIEMDVGEPGELIIQGPQVMSGYHQRPEETEVALRDGWLYTGDVAKMDQDGYFYLVDRKKDVIKVGGFQVWPNEIEAVIRQHPKVCEAAVAGVSDPEGKEAAKAWIVLQKGAICTSEEIKEFCKKYLTGYKIPRYIEFRDNLPKTTVGKVLRRVLVSEHSHKMNEG